MGGPSGTDMKRALLTAFVFLLLPLSSVYAQTVPLEVWVIGASREPGGRIDPEILSLVQDFKRDFAYTSFELLQKRTGQVDQQRPFRTPIPGGRDLNVALVGADQKRVELKVTTSGVKTRVRIHRGGSPFVVGGPAYRNGVLIIAIFAR